MKRKKFLQRIASLALGAALLLGNVPEVYAAQPVSEIIMQESEDEEAGKKNYSLNLAEDMDSGIRIITEKETYQEGEMVNFRIANDTEKEIEKVKAFCGEDAVELTFLADTYSLCMPAGDVRVAVTFRLPAGSITITCKDMYGQEKEELFHVTREPEKVTVGENVRILVEYKGSFGWTAEVTTESGALSYEMTGAGISFEMTEEDVTICLKELEDYDRGDLSGEDSELGEDIGKDHGVTTKKAYEPDISLGKSARWTDIEKGMAELTLTEQDTSDWSDNPSDYIIVLDRTRTMALDDICFWSESSDNIGASHSVCLNKSHYYKLSGLPVLLYDYSHGQWQSTRAYFTTDGISKELWKRHYNASGNKITPSLSNGCYDRLTLAQNSIRDIMDVLEAQNQNQLAGGKKNRVMYWSFSGPTYADKSLHPDGLWNEVPEFTTDISAAKNAIKYETYAGTYYNNSFDRILQKINEKQNDPQYKDIPTKVIFISDGLQGDKDRSYTAQRAAQIKSMGNTKLYTILIGNDANSEAGHLMRGYATDQSCFATVNQSWDTFVSTITAIQQDQFEIGAVEKVLTDKVDTRYWEVVGEPILTEGNGTAFLNSSRSVLTWNLPTGEGKTYTCKLKLKLKDEYRYLLSDTFYPTNLDENGADEGIIQNAPDKAGAVLSYKIHGGKYNAESRKIGVKTPELKYGTVNFSGTKYWTVEGSNAESVKITLKRTMPGSTLSSTINNTTTNVTKKWKYSFQVRQMPDGTTYPLIKYNNAGREISYEILETLPEYYQQIHQTEMVSNQTVIHDFYNEPYKIKAQLTKVDEETKNPLQGAEFTVYTWSKKKNCYVPYKGTTNSASAPCETGTTNGAEEAVKMTETEKGTYITPVWLYYCADNEGKFRIIETKAPEGYFGDWRDGAKAVEGFTDADKNVYDFQIEKDVLKNKETILFSNTEEGNFTNQRVLASVEFSKNDLEAGDQTAQGDATLLGAEYALYAAKDIIHQDGSTGLLHSEDTKIPVRMVSNENGVRTYHYDPNGTDSLKIDAGNRIVIQNLELGKYYLKETKASEGYLIDPTHYPVDLTYRDEKTEIVAVSGYQVYEQVKKQALTFYKVTGTDKTDRLDPLEGAKFSVYLVSDLADGKYVDVPDEELVQKIIDDFRDPTSLDYREFRSISPAVIYDQSGSSDVREGRLVKSVRYADGKTWKAPEKENAYLAAELESDERGIVQTPALPYGRYLLVETTVPENVTATRPFVIHVTADDEDQSTDGDGQGERLDDLVILMDRPIKALIRIRKTDTKSKNVVLKEGAAYLIHDVEGAWFDYVTAEMTTAQKNAYKETYGDLVVQYSQGVFLGTQESPYVTKKIPAGTEETDSVYIETPKELPAGMYELEEIMAPEGYVLQGQEGVIAKKEGLSGNRTFYETENTGKWKETPQGRTRFLVSSSEALYDTKIASFVINVKQQNEPAIGKISIYTEGEVLTAAKQDGKTFFDTLAEWGKGFLDDLKSMIGLEVSEEPGMTEEDLSKFQDYEFIYEMKPIEGAEFEIRAAEAIDSPEGGANAERIFEKGDLVVTLSSNENGQAWTGQEDWEGTEVAKGLPLGTYTVTQTKTAEGFFLSEEDKKPREIKITYAGQEVPVIYRDTSYSNPRQQVKIEVTKTDAETKEMLAGAAFGLYTMEDIKNHNEKTLVKAGTLISVAETLQTADGSISNAVFAPDLPHGNYYVKELRAPQGYQLDQTAVPVEAMYTKADVAIVKKCCEVKNHKQSLLVEELSPVERYMVPEPQEEPQIPVTEDKGNILEWSLLLTGTFCSWMLLRRKRTGF